MKKIALIVAAIATLGMPALALADHVHVGVGIGIGGPGYYGRGWYGGPRYYYGPGYYGPAYYGYYGYAPYYYPPQTVYAPPAYVVEQAPATYWYYCPSARAYYPYVQQCAEGWQAVPAQPGTPPAAQGAPQPAPQANAQPAPAPSGRVTYSLGDLLFATGEAELQPAATATLDSMLASINKDPQRPIVVVGHTDNKGGDAYNRDLSRRRAEAVRVYLINHGVRADRVTALGKGEEAPIADNATAKGRQQNRRVDVTVG